MGKFAVAILAGIGGFLLTSGLLGGGSGGESGDGWYAEAQREGCMRQMRELLPDEDFASSACTCVSEGFEAAGYEMTDAFGDDFDAMSRITRSCASRYGATLPN